MRICLIHNPRNVSGDQILETLPESIAEHQWELRAASAAADIRRLACDAVSERFDRLIVAGGDGTVWQAIQGLAPNFLAIELAVLPFGTGNDFARSLGLNPDLLALASSYACGRQVETVDLMRITAGEITSYCANVANGGFGGRVAADVHAADKQRWGSLAYWVSSLVELTDPQAFTVELTIDDGPPITTATLGLAIANGRFVGGGFPIAPHAQLNDGLLDVIVLPVLESLELMAIGIGFTLGFDQLDDAVQSYRAHRVRMRSYPGMPFSVDGEPEVYDDAAFEVLPQALRVVVGDFPAALIDSRSPGRE